MEKIAALFVLYQPTEDNLRSVRENGKYFDRCFIFDNSPEKDLNLEQFPDDDYFSDGENYGLAFAYNRALDWAVKEGYRWLAVFDQDSRLLNPNPLKEAVTNAGAKDAVFVPFICYAEGQNPQADDNEEVDWAINSGSILNVDLLQENGIRYDDYYFLDRLDRDFCKQVTDKGLKIIRVNRTVLIQRLGEEIGHTDVHSPVRNYYLARNRLYYNHKFFPAGKRQMLDLLQMVKHICGIVSSRHQVRENLKMIRRGIQDYHHGISGKADL